MTKKAGTIIIPAFLFLSADLIIAISPNFPYFSIMDLKIFFSALDETLYESKSGQNTFLDAIHINQEVSPGLNGADIALIGIQENRGTENNKGVDKAADVIRKKLYALKKGTGSYRIVDLGNLRNGNTLEDTYLRIKEVCRTLIEQNVLPILIGGSHDIDYGQYLAYEDMEKLVSVLNIDAMLDLETEASTGMSKKHINRILMHDPNFLFNYTHLAYQSYLIDQSAIGILEKLYFESYRLGHLRQHLQEMEPVIRYSDMLSFDITAIKSSDAPGNKNAQAFGLTGEEACQICWYAGLNDKLSTAGFYEYNPEADDHTQKTASVVATMIWYFIEGFYHRRNEKDFRANDYLRYVVSMPSEPEKLIFYKSKMSEKWWMEVAYPKGKKVKGLDNVQYGRNCIIPCSYADYEAASRGELPERWIITHAKLI